MTLHTLALPTSVNFTHRGDYRRYSPSFEPIIEVDIASVTSSGILGGTTKTSVLIDSGADVTMLDASLASILKIDLLKCQTIEIHGVGPTPVYAKEADVRIELCGKWHKIPVWFAPGMRTQLLGRKGAMDGIMLLFDHGNRLVFARST